MLSPPPAIYNSIDKLYRDTQTFAKSQDYALIKKRTRKNCYSELKNITLHCDWDGVYNNSLGLIEKTHKRYKGTRLIDCPFELYTGRHNDNQWYLEVHNVNYNHNYSEDILGHPITHWLTELQQETVAAITVTGSRSQEILSTLR